MATDGVICAGYDKIGLDREYDNRSKVADAASIAERWSANGKAARNSMSCRLDIGYGAHERHKLDIFPASPPGAPILVFLHGGYWHSRDKSLVHFIAPLYVAAGINVISVGYRLCPEVGIGDIVEDVRAALGWIHQNAMDFDADPRRLFVAGHSAGGHLAAMMCGPKGMEPGIISGGCSISGLHDLEPIRLCYLNETLGLNKETATALSPIALARNLTPTDGRDMASLPPLILTVGGDEGPEYARQRDDLVAALRAARQPVSVVDSPGNNHFTACEAFCDPAHPLSDAMLRLILTPSF
jgi:arylformamidase